MNTYLSTVLAAICIVSGAATASAVGNIVTEVRSNVEVSNSEANEAVDTAECTADHGSSACNDSCHGDDTCNGGDGGDGGDACGGSLTNVNVGNNNCQAGDGGQGGNSSGGQDGSDGDPQDD